MSSQNVCIFVGVFSKSNSMRQLSSLKSLSARRTRAFLLDRISVQRRICTVQQQVPRTESQKKQDKNIQEWKTTKSNVFSKYV